MHCDVCNALALQLWASSDIAGSPIRVCQSCIEEDLDLHFVKREENL